MKESRYRQSGRSQRNGMEATSWHIWLVVERSRREPQAERENQRNVDCRLSIVEFAVDDGGRSFVASLLRMTGGSASLLRMTGGPSLLRMTGGGERRAQRAAPAMKRR